MPRVQVNNQIAKWAIQRAGFSLTGFEQDNPKHKDWLEGKKQPTLNYAQEFAKKVHLPFGYLFLDEPPELELPIPYYRTLDDQPASPSTNLFDLVQDVQRRQDWLVDYLTEKEADPLPFVGAFSTESSATEIIEDIRNTLDLPENWAEEVKQNPRSYLIEKIEAAGIYTSFSSSAGRGNNRPIEVEECRGFVLVNALAPFVWVNSKDAKNAQVFTLIHELAHIWLGESAAFDFEHMQPAQDAVEEKCNQIAAELLVPQAQLQAKWQGLENIERVARSFAVSPIVIGRRAKAINLLSEDVFFDWYGNYVKRVEKNAGGGGGDFYNNAKYSVGRAFGAKVQQALQEGNLLYSDAFRLTGLKGKTFDKYFNPGHGLLAIHS